MKRKTFEICKDGYVVATSHAWNSSLAAMRVHLGETLRESRDHKAYARTTMATNKAPDGKDHIFGMFEWVNREDHTRHVYTIVMVSPGMVPA